MQVLLLVLTDSLTVVFRLKTMRGILTYLKSQNGDQQFYTNSNKIKDKIKNFNLNSKFDLFVGRVCRLKGHNRWPSLLTHNIDTNKKYENYAEHCASHYCFTDPTKMIETIHMSRFYKSQARHKLMHKHNKLHFFICDREDSDQHMNPDESI